MAVGRPTREELADLVRCGEIETILVAVPDLQGRLQGKRMDAAFLLEELGGGPVEGCAYVLATDVDMRTLDGYALTSWDAGYGDLAFVPDYATVRRLPWQSRSALVIADAVDDEGRPVAVAPRAVLQGQLARLAERGWSARCGTELEFMVFAETYEAAWDDGYRHLTPVNRYNVDYSLQGTSRIEELLGRLHREMRGAGMVVESIKGECNFGQHEMAFRYADALDKCDEHSLYKLGAKEIAAQEGCALTFMAKVNEREGNSCHIHLSVADANGVPIFGAASGHAPVFDQFLAGLVAHIGDLTLLLAPTLNSYKRFVPGSFAPTALLWGRDNRTCAFRVVGHGPSLRVECRIAGGDANPYLAVAALVAAGLAGVEAGLAPVPEFTGNAYLATAARVPSTIDDAVRRLRDSAVARGAFGDDVVDHLVRAGEVEIEAFGRAVTDWERFRGFERL